PAAPGQQSAPRRRSAAAQARPARLPWALAGAAPGGVFHRPAASFSGSRAVSRVCFGALPFPRQAHPIVPVPARPEPAFVRVLELLPPQARAALPLGAPPPVLPEAVPVPAVAGVFCVGAAPPRKEELSPVAGAPPARQGPGRALRSEPALGREQARPAAGVACGAARLLQGLPAARVPVRRERLGSQVSARRGPTPPVAAVAHGAAACVPWHRPRRTVQRL